MDHDVLHSLKDRLARALHRSGDVLEKVDLLAPPTPEKEETVLNGIADTIVRFRLETPSMFFLESTKPMAFLLSSFLLTVSAPVLEMFGVQGYDYASTFQKRDSMERLMQKIEEKATESKKEGNSEGLLSFLVAKRPSSKASGNRADAK